MLGESRVEPAVGDQEAISPSGIPVCLLYGTDDAFVSVELGRQAARALRKMGLPVEWHEYNGAENEGHWIKEPEGFDQIVEFLESRGVKC